MLETFTWPRFLLTIAVLFGAWLLYFLRKAYIVRTHFHRLPGPPHSYIWGSLPAMAAVINQLPKRAAGQCFFLPIKEKYNLGDYFYLDPWPFADPLLLMFDTDMMNQITVKTSLPKHKATIDFVHHVGGPGNLVTAEGAEWKKWRSAFNPGFSASHLMTLVPVIVDQCTIFRDIMMKRAATHDLFRMELATTKLTVDIIGKVVLDLDFNTQKGQRNAMVDALIRQLRWIFSDAGLDPLATLDLRRPVVLAYNTWIMNRYCSQRVEERFASRAGRDKTKAIIDLALEAYVKDVKSTGKSVDDLTALDPEFKQAAVSNLKVFIFAGHDTTSATICYAYYYLSKDPTRLSKVRKELDEVFGTDESSTAEQLKNDPHMLNRLDYTMAIIREVLRLQPPASTLRAGYKDFILRDPKTGDAIPSEHGVMLFPLDVGYHRLKEYWGDPHVFRPERFYDSDSYNKDAWIPFSKGPRNCIGQELAIIETKAILAMTLRSFDFKAAFDELEKLKNDGTGYPSDTSGIQEVYGEQAYQIQLGTAKPREGMPCRLSLRDSS